MWSVGEGAYIVQERPMANFFWVICVRQVAHPKKSYNIQALVWVLLLVWGDVDLNNRTIESNAAIRVKYSTYEQLEKKTTIQIFDAV